MADRLIVKGAREHNLRSVDLDLPRDALIVFTGLSGSGKSSLAFDTIFAEGQRRYVESLSAYARQFLGQMDKPDVDFIEGLSPAVSIDQKSTSRNPRSTVGTITEVYDYLRLLYARAGRPHCPECGEPIARQTPQQIVDRILAGDQGARFQVLAPIIRGRKVGSSNALITNQHGRYRFTLQDSELVAAHPSPHINGIIGANFTVKRANIHGVVDQIHVTGGSVRIEASWLHDNLHFAKDPYHRDGSHDDNVQVQGGSSITIVGNHLSGAHNAALQVTQDRSAVSALRFTGNWVDDGGCTVNIAQKKRGPIRGITVSENVFGTGSRFNCGIIASSATLERLAVVDPRRAQVVEHRMFAGLSTGETARLLDVSTGTVERDWRAARAWLFTEIAASGDETRAMRGVARR